MSKHILVRPTPVRIRRKIIAAAVDVCAKELAPFMVTRKHDADALWWIVFHAAEWDDIYRLAWTLDYYAFECTTSYMDIALKLRRSLNAHWLSETSNKIHKEVRDGEARRRTPLTSRTKSHRAKAHKQKRQR